ncbi:S-adenosyl-L-methionine-dependent methyltransferase [Westerdykella ornata]|uniref:S-adenosyl-L-methionine-dependent methyltransferase n=1 Tax=Westerdykella ornata TaxID=318751 RepID=A0A6A6JW85_WESOR|nr:S-adenosyl-L-methionine-dependent methyltransferase [Westerdykella ornata]KAF2280353.1 S-adenosyl-L-methionine-dependent methyltransferase [Westerdykella ornata]
MGPNNFTPKQCPQKSKALLDSLQGDQTTQIARHALSLIPAITSESIIHDNACGAGPVTTLIAESSTPAKLQATDIDETVIQTVAEKAKQHGWNFVETGVMDATELRFQDNTFTHSIMNFGIQAVPQPQKVAAEIYRTLKPGGSTVLTSWASTPHSSSIEDASRATRDGEGTAHSARFPPHIYTVLCVETLLKDAGFKSVYVEQFPAYYPTGNVKSWAESIWGLIGEPVGGWTQNDEEKWDNAIAEMMESLKNNPDVEVNPNGSGVMKYVANVAVASK